MQTTPPSIFNKRRVGYWMEILTRERWRLLGNRIPFEGLKKSVADRNDDQMDSKGSLQPESCLPFEDLGFARHRKGGLL